MSQRAPSLSPRLAAILEEIGSCDLLADVCADHARLALAAVAFGVAKRAIAIELRARPLQEAREHLRKSKLAGRVLLVRADGLDCLRRADALVLAGIGGDLAAQLLTRSIGCAHAARIVVQPNRHGREVRAWALGAGFRLERERVLRERDTLHLLLTFVRDARRDRAYGKHPREAELMLGPRLLLSPDEGAQAFLRAEHKRLRKLKSRRPDFAEALAVLDEQFPSGSP